LSLVLPLQALKRQIGNPNTKNSHRYENKPSSKIRGPKRDSATSLNYFKNTEWMLGSFVSTSSPALPTHHMITHTHPQISQKEYAEDTVFWSLKPATAFSARRRTTALFLANATTGPPFHVWVDNTPELWTSLRSVLEKEDPKAVAINVDPEIAFSSGMHAGELNMVQKETGLADEKLVSVPLLAVEFVATMPEAQLGWYRKLQSTAWSMISEAFSEAVITPGETTTADVEWWLRDQIQAWNYTTWFMPDVSILPLDSIGSADSSFSFLNEDMDSMRGGLEGVENFPREDVIQYGDLLHVDFGVTALGMNTDTQHLAYVLYPGQTEADIPAGLKAGLKKANRLQDILRENMKIGMSGNEILKNTLKQMSMESIKGKIYSHPIGDWGHSAGTLIGSFPTYVDLRLRLIFRQE
jgi:hypothetical protein